MSALPGNLLFAQGCVPNQASTTWYRVLNSSGATLLKGNLDRYQFFQQAGADSTGNLFALASSRFDSLPNFSLQVRAGDFNNLAIEIFSPQTGKLLFGTHLPSGSSQRETFALSPSGGSLSVLTGDLVRTYVLPPQVESSR